MTLQEVKQHFQEALKGIFSPEEVDAFFFLIVEKELGYTKSKTLANLKDELSMGENIMMHGCLNRLRKSEPIQYILEETEFYGISLKVTPDTLIPRPETEELVQWIVQDWEGKNGKIEVLDIGTGSGCIAVSLAKHLVTASVEAMDFSKKALKVALENARNHGVAIAFVQQDVLKLETLSKSYDVLVSNPPYVREMEKREIQKNVLDYEPASALFVANEDPLLFYRAIARLAKGHLKEGGLLYYEINEYLSKELIQMLEEEGFKEIQLKKDLFGKDRMVKCSPGEPS